MPVDLSLVDAAAQLTFAVHEVLTRAAAELGLSVTQLRMLGILRDRTPTMASLADQLALDRSSVSGLVDRAATKGLVERAPSETDRRVVTVGLTAAGREAAVRIEAVVEPRIEALLESASAADQAALRRLAATLPSAV
ncbi:DNA-binding MarR family transcriptional regulator [Frondihabitans sp. PhB188]|uniref:MarR family winged helix-turn-helix transcriptional regulator n=1 Tax=Frondihabitans sp. PhB188 TaxID=2485200 RepID=UPI000F473355|nr:MarR family transcriptional regulator [Frondihabitans sp. PhB188]ROQ40868.1 DNA-binding MarR family transcriptional regulator [Frondihabitans sp. PhB188]